MSEKNGGPYVAIAGTVGGISLAIVVIFALLAKEQLAISAWIVGALAVMGMYLGHAASRKH